MNTNLRFYMNHILIGLYRTSSVCKQSFSIGTHNTSIIVLAASVTCRKHQLKYLSYMKSNFKIF